MQTNTAWKRIWFILGWTVLIVGTLGSMGCTKSKSEPVVIYLRMGSPVEQGIWRELFNTVKTKNPDIEIKVLNVPYESYWSKFFTLTASGNPPDMVMMESGFYPSFVQKNTLLDLSEKIRSSKLVKLEDFHKSALDWLMTEGRIYGLPSDAAVIIPFFNLDLFKEAGVELPGEDWTWDQYLEIARKLTRDTDGDGKNDVWGTTMPPWESAIWSQGADWVDNPEKPTRCTFDDPRVIEAIQWIADARLKYGVAFRSSNTQTSDPDFFLTGKIAISWNGHWAVPEYIAKADFQWDVGMLPLGKGGRGGWNRGSCFSIPTKAKHPDKAWRIIEFICSEEGIRFFANKNIITPVHLSVLKSREFMNLRPPEHQEYFVKALDHGHILPKSTMYKEFLSMINMELEHVWTGELDAQAVCKRIADKGTSILNEGSL